MAVKEELIKALIIQYDNSIRLQKKLIDCGFAEALLSVIPIFMKNQEALEALLNKRTNECERLKKCLETARDKVSALFKKHEENTYVKEFLDFAVFLSTFRDSNEDIDAELNSGESNLLQYCGISLEDKFSGELNRNKKVSYTYSTTKHNNLTGNEHESKKVELQFDELADECTTSKLPLSMSNEDIVSTLNSKLKIAHESLNAEKLLRKRAENEREKLDSLSENLCCLLQKYHKRICVLVKANETNAQTSSDSDHMKINEKYNADSFTSQPDGHNSENNPYIQNNCVQVQCNICHKYFLHKKSLRVHMRIQHGGETSKPFKCAVCGKSFIWMSHLERHILTHGIGPGCQKPFKCSLCEWCTRNSSDLIKHEKTVHKKEIHFECSHCGKRYGQKIHLISHIFKMHFSQSQKPFTCNHCYKSFLNQSHLKRHQLIHSSRRPFKCTTCDKVFKQSGNKKMHEARVHKKN